MDNSFAVGGCQSTGHLFHNVDRFRNSQLFSPLQDVVQILAIEKLHRDELHALRLAQVVNPDHVAMGNLRREQQFLFETGQNLGIRSHLRTDDLQGYGSIYLAVGSLVHSPHAAFSEEFENLIAAAKNTSDLQQNRASATTVETF